MLDLLEELNVAVVDDLLCHESMQFRTPHPGRGDRGLKLAYRFLDLKGASPSMSPRSPGASGWPSWPRHGGLTRCTSAS